MKLIIRLLSLLLLLSAAAQETPGSQHCGTSNQSQQCTVGTLFLQTASVSDLRTKKAAGRNYSASKEYMGVMSATIHRYGTPPASEATVKNHHRAWECRVPTCRRADCDNFHPDCCNAKMARMLADVTNFLQKRGHSFAATFGTLLGAVRDQAIIPWTEDIDLSVDEAGINALLEQEEIPYRFFRQPGVAVVRGCPYYKDGAQRYWVSPGGNIASLGRDDHTTVFYYIDIYQDSWIQTDSHAKWTKCLRQSSVPATEVVQVYDMKIPSVVDSQACLQACFGSAWNVPRHSDWGDRLALVGLGGVPSYRHWDQAPTRAET